MHPKPATMNPQSAIAQSIQSEAQAFAIAYAENWDTPDASSLEHYTTVASKAGRYYAPGCVLATQSERSILETPEAAEALIAKEMRECITSGLGCHMKMVTVDTVTPNELTPESALEVSCCITFRFHPQPGHRLEGRPWTFMNRYIYRAARPELGHALGWILVSREDEVSKMRQMTGPSPADALMGLPQP